MEKKTGGKKKKEKTDENSGHYVIASSGPPERRPLERRTLAPICLMKRCLYCNITTHISVYKIDKIYCEIKLFLDTNETFYQMCVIFCSGIHGV